MEHEDLCGRLRLARKKDFVKMQIPTKETKGYANRGAMIQRKIVAVFDMSAVVVALFLNRYSIHKFTFICPFVLVQKRLLGATA